MAYVPKTDDERRREARETVDLEDIKNSISIIDYARDNLGFTITKAGKGFSLKEHDSVRISPDGRLYKRWSTGRGGSIIDFVSEMDDLTVAEAIVKLGGYAPDSHTSLPPAPPVPEEEKEFDLPAKNADSKRTIAYLTQSRGIDMRILAPLLKSGKLYEEAGHHNAVFVVKDAQGEPVRAIINGTSTYTRFKQDLGDNSYPFSFGRGTTVYVFESPIDALSHATLQVRQGYTEWAKLHRIALGSATKLECITRYLDTHSEIDEVILSFDNDEPGRKAVQKSIQTLNAYSKEMSRRFSISTETSKLKDWNDDLCAAINQRENFKREMKV